MASSNVTLTGDYAGMIYDGKKLVVTSDFKGTNVTVPSSSDKSPIPGYKEGKTAGSTLDGGLTAAKLSVISVEGAAQALNISGGSKATSIYLGTGGGTVGGSTAVSDKFYGNTGTDTFRVAKGDAIGDGKETVKSGYGKGDLIIFEGASSDKLTFTDSVAKNQVVITNGSDKVTVYKNKDSGPISIQGGVDKKTIVYGVDGSTVTTDSKGTTLTIAKNAKGTLDASMMVSTAKNIDATKVTDAVYLIGNGNADNISIGTGGGTIYGGVAVKAGKNGGNNTYSATADNLYGNAKAESVTFLLDSLAGSDNIYNYKDGDTIKITDVVTKVLDFSNSKVLKDGGSGKDVAITYGKDGKSKLTIKTNTANRIVFDVNGTIQAYGSDLADGVSLNSARTALEISNSYDATNVSIEGWTNGLENESGSKVVDNNALKTLAPKLNTIDASKVTNKELGLYAQATIASVLKSGTKGASMYGGTGADQYDGGTGSDTYIVDVSKTVGKDVISTYGAGDVVVVNGITSTDTTVSLDSKGVIYFSSKKEDQKTNSVTVKNFKNTTKAAPVIVVDGRNSEILAVGSNAGAPTPRGLNVDSKSGISTTKDYDGVYSGTAVVGATINLSNRDIDTSVFDDETTKILDANAYGGTAKAINASVVADELTSLKIVGNAVTKNTIYLPNKTDKDTKDISVTVEGGSGADTFIGHTTTTKTTVTYISDSLGGKDVIEGYNEGDAIVLGVASLAAVSGLVNDTKLSEKGSDVTFTYDSKNSLTIKNAAGKTISFVDSKGNTYTYGYELPEGLSYDSKKTAINAGSSFEGMDEVLNLNNTTVSADHGYYYAGIKTVSLSGASETAYATVVGSSTVANEIYAPKGGSFLYGGDIDTKTKKATVDKLYGNEGTDVFAYKQGVGADVIGDAKKTVLAYNSEDFIYLGSDDATALTADELTFSDKKNVLTITYNGDKNSKLTVNKVATDTPVKIVLGTSVVGSEDSSEDVAGIEDYFVYGIDTRTFKADASTNLEKGNLVIGGGGTVGGGGVTTVVTNADGSTETKAFAAVNVKYVSSGIKNVSVGASDVVVSLVGGANALNVTTGAAGGTVEGGSNGTKSFADKFVSGGNTTFVIGKDTGGKDVINNYDPNNGDVLFFKDGMPTYVKFSSKSIVFAYSSDAKNSLTINAKSGTSFSSETNVRIRYNVLDKNGRVTSFQVNTYYGWDAKVTDFSKYGDFQRDEHWTKSGDKYIYIGQEGEQLKGTNYTLEGSSIVDADNNYEPDNIVIGPSNGSISFDNGNATDTYIDPVYNGFHVQGTAQYNGGTQTSLQAGHTFTANGTTYTLANVDGNADNGFELTKNGWVKLGTDSFTYIDTTADTASVNSTGALYTIQGAISDNASPGADNDPLGKFAIGASSKEIIITVASSETEIANSHIKLNDVFNTSNLKDIGSGLKNNFAYSNEFTVKTRTDTTTTLATYKLYDGDGNDANGYELLRTDIASAKHWTLETPYGTTKDIIARATAQKSGVGYWQYSDTTTGSTLVFEVNAAAGVKANDDGTPVGISVSGTTVHFDSSSFDISNVVFANDTKTGSETGAVHVSGLAVGTAISIDDTVYTLAEFDGDSSNGYELLKSTDGWTYDNGAWIYDGVKRYAADAKKSTIVAGLQFTISADASLQADEDGAPKDVKVYVDESNGMSTIDATGLKTAHIVGASATRDLITESGTTIFTFGNITTGDVRKTARIVGFDSETTAFTIGAGEYYLADLDSSTDAYELLPVNTNWKRTADGWVHYPDPEDPNDDDAYNFASRSSDITLTLTDKAGLLVFADANGAPMGVSVSGDQITIDETFGTVSSNTADNHKNSTQKVMLTSEQITLAGDVSINASGMHILGTSKNSSVAFGAGSTIQVGDAAPKQLANLDRDASNGYELLTTVAGWTFNNGEKSNATLPAYALGSWTFSSDTKVGENEAGLTFSVSEEASLLAVDVKGETDDDTVAAGVPGGIYVSIGEAASDATIYADSSIVSSSQLIFSDATAAAALFQTSTGVHFVGFADDDTVAVSNNKGANVAYYRVKELNGNNAAGFELLKVSDTDVWSLTANEDTSWKRAWTYADANVTLNTSSDANLLATADGRTFNLSVATGTNVTDTTISINQESSETATLNVEEYLTVTTTNVGSGTSIHFIGVDSNTTVSVYDGTTEGEGDDVEAVPRVYRFANMDANSDTKELLAYNENWRYYDSEITLANVAGGDDKSYTAGTWIYNKTFGEGASAVTFSMVLDSEVGLSGTFGARGSKTGIASADANGAPIGITINSDASGFGSLVLDFNADALNIKQAEGKTTSTTLFSHITLSSNTGIGATGIHIIGFDSGTTKFNLGAGDLSSEVYLAELDGDSSNGYELIRSNDQWTRTADGWTYTTDTVSFTLGTTLAADALGAPEGVTVVAGSSDGEVSNTLVIDVASVDSASLLNFVSFTPGSSAGLHVSLVGTVSEDSDWNGASFTSGTTTYTLAELDGDTSTGYELLITNDKGWALSTDSVTGARTWTYTSSVNDLSFDVGPATDGKGLKAGADGLPVGVTVATDTTGSRTSLVESYWITFSATDTGITELTTTSDQLKFNVAPTGINGIHIKGLADSNTDVVYTTDASKMFTIGEDTETKYYLANINNLTTNNGKLGTGEFLELLKNDDNWHRTESGWTFDGKNDADISFTLDSGNTTANLIMPASAENEGKPDGISVSALDDDNWLINVSTSAKVADGIIFSTDTSFNEYLHVSLSSANNVSEFTLRSYGTGDNPNTDTTYYVVNSDHNANNGKEFYLKDTDSSTGIWKRTEAGWDYFTSGTGITEADYTTTSPLAFSITILEGQDGYDGRDAGLSVPSGITVDTDTRYITFSGSTDYSAENVTLYSGRFSDTVTLSAEGALVFNSPHFIGNFNEGDTIKTSGNTPTTYYLYNADGNTENGLELTFNGWTSYTSGETKYYAFVQGENQIAGRNIGFILSNDDQNVFKPASDSYPSIAGVEGDTNSLELTAGSKPTEGFVVSALTSTNFHVKKFADNGAIAEGKEVAVGNLTYKLKEVDGNANNGFELVDETSTWARMTADGKSIMYVGNGSDTSNFTLTSGSKSLDTNYDFVPDKIDVINFDSKTSKFSVTFFGTEKDTGDLRFNLAASVTGDTVDTFIIKFDGDADDKTYILNKDGNSGYKIAESVAADQTTTPMMPSDIDDLINYDNSASFSSDLESILDTNDSGVAENLNLFDASDELMGVATNDRTISALSTKARHKARK